MHNSAIYYIIQTTLQGYGPLHIVIHVFFYGSVKKHMFRNTSFHTFIEKGRPICHEYVCSDEYRKMIFLRIYNSKSVLLQRASCSHTGTHT